MNWFRKFIRGFSAITKCLYKLVKKVIKFQWEAEHQHAFDELKSSLINSEALAFPRYDLPFYVSVDRSSKGIGYMLYQKHPSTEYENEKVRVVRFGSKSLTNYQQAYGPTKLELLGMVTSILDCSSYLRGRSFIVECDHQALKPLFQKQLKGAIYERWLAILQEFDFEIRYKPAEQMVVADVLSRCQQNSQKNAELSPDESDNCFPYVKETHRDIKLPNGTSLEERLHNREINQNIVVNHVVMKPRSNIPSHCRIESAYDADTEDHKLIRRDKSRVNRRNRKNDLNTNLESINTNESDKNNLASNTCTSNSEQMYETTELSSIPTSGEETVFEGDVKNLELFSKFDFSVEKIKKLQQNDAKYCSII